MDRHGGSPEIVGEPDVVWLNDVMPQWLASSWPKHFRVIDEG
jgi:hypothetical protein